MSRDPLAALADHLDPPEPGSRACVIEILCDDAAVVVAEARAARAVLGIVRHWPSMLCLDCYESGCAYPDEDDGGLCACEDSCHARDAALREALAAYDRATGHRRPDLAAHRPIHDRAGGPPLAPPVRAATPPAPTSPGAGGVASTSDAEPAHPVWGYEWLQESGGASQAERLGEGQAASAPPGNPEGGQP